jgi:hypothetical protein
VSKLAAHAHGPWAHATERGVLAHAHPVPSPPPGPPAQLGGPHKATAAPILKLMRVAGLTTLQVNNNLAWHRQKLAEVAAQQSSGGAGQGGSS